jgi:predicted AAA+ superfamily ATPase
VSEPTSPFAILLEKFWLDWRARFSRLDRLLQLGVEVLEDQVPQEFPPGFFHDHLAFRWDGSRGVGHLHPVQFAEPVSLDELIGVEHSIHRFTRNIEQFVSDLPANHVLLYGERGTGKSTAVRALLPRFGSRRLRIVEVVKQDLIHLPNVLKVLSGVDHKFLIFCDDLSFDEGEAGFRELKAALEGSLEAPPENIKIVATSNRRHLMPEYMAENRDVRMDEKGELRLSESLEEKLALADRFGLALQFTSFDQETYLAIVNHYIEKAKLDLPEVEVRARALRFALDRSSRSGRTAKQFVDDLAGRVGLGEIPSS